MTVFEFMAKMLFFLPDFHEKGIRYYGFYVRPAKLIEKQEKITQSNWSTTIQHCFQKKPELCPVQRCWIRGSNVRKLTKNP